MIRKPSPASLMPMTPAAAARFGEMIYYLSTAAHQYTLRTILESAEATLGDGLEPLRQYRLLSYERLSKLRRLPAGSYIFSDLERLDPAATERAALAWNALAESRHDLRLLNHPIRSMRRFELLRHLHSKGVNDFAVRRLTDADLPGRLPVFIRDEGEHRGSLTPLLPAREAFAAAVEELVAAGRSRDDKLVIEYLDTADRDGIHHRYSAQIIGSRITPACLYFSRDWMVKNRDPRLAGEEFAAAEQRYLAANPHEAMIRPIFAMAGIEFGRMDYAVVDGKVQVFEINTNPSGVRASTLVEAVAEIDSPADRHLRIPVTARHERPWREPRGSHYWFHRLIYHARRALRPVRARRRRIVQR
jgi:hypothetical protein